MGRNAHLAEPFRSIVNSMLDVQRAAVDPRDPDPSREGVFRDHNCWRCKDGAEPCVVGNPRRCEYLRARND